MRKIHPTLPYITIFSVVLALDQLLKAYARTFPLGEPNTLIPGLFWWTHVQNTGASFGILQNGNTGLIWVSLIVLGLLLWYHEEFRAGTDRIFYTLILSGLFGNLIDRIQFGSVTDMFDLGWFPIFNIADSALVVGVIGLSIVHWQVKKRTSRPRKS